MCLCQQQQPRGRGCSALCATRMQRHHESAKLSRQSSNMGINGPKCGKLAAQVKHLARQLGRENALLRHHLVAVCRRARGHHR